MSRFTTVKDHATYQHANEVTTVIPSNLYNKIVARRGDDYAFGVVDAFQYPQFEENIPFWEWLNLLEDTLCLDLQR